MDLDAQAVGAAYLGNVRGFFLWILIEAGKADAVGNGPTGALAVGAKEHRGAVIGAGGYVTGHHGEAWRKWLDVGAIGATAKIVDCHTVGGDLLEGFVRVLVIEQRSPIGGFVGLNLAGGAMCLLEAAVGGVGADIWSAELVMLKGGSKDEEAIVLT